MRLYPQEGTDMVKKLYKMMIATDATLVEINPLAETSDGRWERTIIHASSGLIMCIWWWWQGGGCWRQVELWWQCWISSKANLCQAWFNSRRSSWGKTGHVFSFYWGVASSLLIFYASMVLYIHKRWKRISLIWITLVWVVTLDVWSMVLGKSVYDSSDRDNRRLTASVSIYLCVCLY